MWHTLISPLRIECVWGKLFCGCSSHQSTPRGTTLLAWDSEMWLSPFQSRRTRLAKTLSYRVYLVRQALRRTAVSIPAEMGKNGGGKSGGWAGLERAWSPDMYMSRARSVSVSEAKQGWHGLCLKYSASSCSLGKKEKKVRIKGLECQGILHEESLHYC